MTLLDRFNRPLGGLRISVTDRCNLRCRYCMPAESYRWLPSESLLSFDELTRVARAFVAQGVSKLRLTGGEPLLRPGVPDLVARLSALDGVTDLALTTNGTRLAEVATDLRRAGLHRLTLSLDTLRPERMLELTRHDRSTAIAAGVEAAMDAGFRSIKMNTVVMRGFNEDELGSIVEFAVERGIEPRFIEYMDVGGALNWQADQVVPRDEILEILSATMGPAEPLPLVDRNAPARKWRFANGTSVGIVSSTTHPFCGDCDRSRLTADGTWYRCLYAEAGTDLRGPLREGESDTQIEGRISAGWRIRDDRGAQERHNLPNRGALVSLAKLKSDPRLEMHVRGG
jgi:cyclic pyranopterin phosphate synthase